MRITEQERVKYKRMWKFDQYRKYAPGESLVADAIERLQMRDGGSVIDFGIGTGRAAQKFKEQGFFVIGIDIAENCLDDDVDIPLIVRPLWETSLRWAHYGFCTDVMEHIPTERVDDVLENISTSVGKCYFQIATFPDALGKLIDDTLHLTIRDIDWWHEVLSRHFARVNTKMQNHNVIAVCKS